MNQEIKAKWLEALRSGKYKQIHTFLNDKHGMCCLGVLCDILDPEAWTKSIAIFNQAPMLMDGEESLPSKRICDLAQVPLAAYEDNGEMTITRKLADFNDRGWSFEQIADYIEANL